MNASSEEYLSHVETSEEVTFQRQIYLLKSDSHLPKKCVICFIESTLKMMRNTFYFIFKALFLLKIFKFLS